MKKWTIGEDAVFYPPCGPDYDFHGYRATSWRDWPASGPEWRDQTSLYPSLDYSEYSVWESDSVEILDLPTQAVDEPMSVDFPDHSKDLRENEPINDLLPPDVTWDSPPPIPDDIEPTYEDDQGSFEFREPPPEDKQLGDPPLPPPAN